MCNHVGKYLSFRTVILSLQVKYGTVKIIRASELEKLRTVLAQCSSCLLSSQDSVAEINPDLMMESTVALKNAKPLDVVNFPIFSVSNQIWLQYMSSYCV